MNENSGNVLGAKPYQTGMPKCRNFGMSDSAKYPGLCKQYEDNQVEQNGDEYAADLEFNSINGREGNAAASHITYKTYNGEYDSKRGNNNGISYVNRNYNRISNNELHSYVKRHQQSPEYQQQQQYASNGATKFQQQQKFVQTQPQQQQQTYRQQQQQQQAPNYQQMTPFLRAFHQQQQQHTQKRPIDRANPFQTYRWDQLFKNHV